MFIFNAIMMDYLYINSLLKSNIHIPMYTRLLSINAVLLLLIAAKPLSHILCDIWLGFDVRFK